MYGISGQYAVGISREIVLNKVPSNIINRNVLSRLKLRILGFNLMENFRQPYFVQSVREFWSRWHISLSTWFRDYLYIPLDGNRVPLWRNLLNLMIVFVGSGLCMKQAGHSLCGGHYTGWKWQCWSSPTHEIGVFWQRKPPRKLRFASR